MKKLIVNDKFENKKISSFFMDSFPNTSMSVFYKLLRKKDIRINGNKISDNIIIHSGDEVQFFIADSVLQKDFPVAYEDDNILVVNKPMGISVNDGVGSLYDCLKQKYKFVEPCHRLDRNTSGLVIFAKNEESLNILFDCFKQHEIEKHYACVVVGKMPQKQDTLNAFLFKDAKKSIVYISEIPKKGYLNIITEYSVLKFSNSQNLSLLDVQIPTGRTHQIRAHLSFIGHPILGDGKYGINEINKRFKYKNQALHSYKLRFNFINKTHLEYLNGKEIAIPFPDYFKELFNS